MNLWSLIFQVCAKFIFASLWVRSDIKEVQFLSYLCSTALEEHSMRKQILAWYPFSFLSTSLCISNSSSILLTFSCETWLVSRLQGYEDFCLWGDMPTLLLCSSLAPMRATVVSRGQRVTSVQEPTHSPLFSLVRHSHMRRAQRQLWMNTELNYLHKQ